jgi:hypothetical protein
MSLEDHLYANTSLSAEDFLKQYFHYLGLDGSVGMINEWIADGVHRDAYNAFARRLVPKKIEVMEALIGFAPTAEIGFTFRKWTAAGEGVLIDEVRMKIISAVIEMLKNTDYDLALSHLDEDYVLCRRGGISYLQQDHPFWTKERLKLIDIEYTLGNIYE